MLSINKLRALALTLALIASPVIAQEELEPGEQAEVTEAPSAENTATETHQAEVPERREALSLAAKKLKSFKNVSLPTGTKPIFAKPSAPSIRYLGDLVGRDQNVVGTLDLSAQAALARNNALNRVQADMRLQKPGTEQFLRLGDSLAKLYEEQAYYLEYLRALNLNDRNFPNLSHSIKATRSQLIAVLDQLVVQFPKSENRNRWRSVALISRIKIGDPSVRNAIKDFASRTRSNEGARVLAVAIATDETSGRRSSYGSVETALKLNIDPVSKSVFKLLSAEQASASAPRRSVSLYEEAAKEGLNIRYPDGSPSPMTLRAAVRMAEVSYAIDQTNANKDVVTSLQSFGLNNVAFQYVEKVALRNTSAQPRRAMAQYADIIALGEQNPETILKIEVRILDIAIGSVDFANMESQWQRLTQIPGGLEISGMEKRIFSTQQLAWKAVNNAASVENVDRFVRLHDFFTGLNQRYAADDNWALKTVTALVMGKRHADVASRADALSAKSQRKDIILASHRYAARAREKILRLETEPTFNESTALARSEHSSAYIVNLDKIASLVKGTEAETSTYQAAFVTYLGEKDAGRERFERAMTRFSKSKYAPRASSFLLAIAIRNKDHVYTEKIARLTEKKGIRPSQSSHRNLRAIIEVAVYAQAENLASENSHEPAAAKYIAFQKEFPKSKNAHRALRKAADNLLAAKQIPEAVTQMESLMKNYPDSQYVFDTRWQAAEQSKVAGQFLRAANHYETFAKAYKSDGKKRQAWLKAAEMHKQLGRYAHTIADYEIYMKEASSEREKIKTAKEIADLQMKYGKPNEAVLAYERVMSMSKNTDDEIWARANLIDIALRQGQEVKARLQITKVLKLKPGSQEGFKLTAKAKFALAKLEAVELRNENPGNQKKLHEAIKKFVANYENVKTLYLASCEVPGLDLCAVGYYESAKLAEEIASKLLDIGLPPTLNRNEVEPIRSTIASESERLGNESRSLAEQAEQALASSETDRDMAERIKNYAESHRGAGK